MSKDANTAKSESHLRVFMSVDLVGSTKLKNELNHQVLIDRYDLYDGFLKQTTPPEQRAELEPHVLQSLGIILGTSDWAKAVEDFYTDFQAYFAAQLQRFQPSSGDLPKEMKADKLRPWKAIGDELIYQAKITGRKQLYHVLIAFFCAMRLHDGLFKDRRSKHGLRLKGTAWVAGFPVRNRVVKVPGKDPLDDYLGPDIDTGFRLGKWTRARMMTVSAELAELLSEVDLDQFLGKIVGWEILKGVWADRHYPIVWIDLPTGIVDKDSEKLAAGRFSDWEHQECQHCRAWDTPEPKSQLRDVVKKLKELRSALPPSLGMIDPYIPGDGEDVIPPQHQRIHELLDNIREFQTKTQAQVEEGPPTQNDPDADPDAVVNDLLGKAQE